MILACMRAYFIFKLAEELRFPDADFLSKASQFENMQQLLTLRAGYNGEQSSIRPATG